MIRTKCDFFSQSLGMATSVEVLLPEPAFSNQIGLGGSDVSQRVPALYLLHGLSDDQTTWGRRTSIERYAAEYGLAVVMPAGNRSFYCNTSDGIKFWDYISEELPERMGQIFHISTRREDTFAAGLSMGGYGALRLGLLASHRFSAVAALSSCVELEAIKRLFGDAIYNADFGAGTAFTGNDYDVFHLASQLAASGKEKPKIFMCCGDEDIFYPVNVRLQEHIQQLGYDLTWVSAPGNHNWAFWDLHIQQVLSWLPLKH